MTGSLVVVGTGIGAARLTAEGRAAIEGADEVLHLIPDPVSARLVEQLNPRSRSLGDCYVEGEHRRAAYARMVEAILDPVRRGARVCAAFYGHPGVFSLPPHEAVKRAREEGFEAEMLPGISAEDCLFADLGVDPADRGWQSFEATDFLLRGYEPDPAAALVLWQVDALGKLDSSPEQEPDSLRVLAERLRELYPGEHELVFYLASSYPIAPATVERIRLDELGELTEAPAPTLYVAPAQQRPIDPDRARALGLTIP